MHESSSDSLQSAAIRVLAVVVLFKLRSDESATVRALQSALVSSPSLQQSVQVLLFDNSPQPSRPRDLPPYFSYEPSANNSGLAAAYNRGLQLAVAAGYDWLLTLDQDTSLPPDFLRRVISLAAQLNSDLPVAAIVPQLESAGRVLSPNYVGTVRNTPVPSGTAGLNRKEVFALNSGSLLRVSALQEIGGFSEEFWLDQLDLWLHNRLHRAGKRVYIAGDIHVHHGLSLLDYDSLSPIRFRNFLEAESHFFDAYKGLFANMALTATLMLRYLKHRLSGGRDQIRQTVAQELKSRLLSTRSSRLRRWNVAAVRGEQQRSRELRRVSVCMAAHNGERFIAAQINSILSQLTDKDEVVVVDDASRDNTCAVLEQLGDPRIRLIRSATNRGVLRTFEDAIQSATGDVIFLSDQDDLWRPEKVGTILEALEAHPEVDIVASDAVLIDEEGNRLGDSYYAQRGTFRAGVLANLLRCRYLGCTMAFRRRIRTRILPFPADADVLHDLWIGTCNAWVGGKALYIDRPLVEYRRHRTNVTGNRRLSRLRQFRIRWDLLRSLIRYRYMPRALGPPRQTDSQTVPLENCK